jgi:nicotinate-nucleotide adenylyltransferase
MRIGLFGGSFNPIQDKHLGIIKDVIENGLVEEVWIVPCKNHAFGKGLASFEERVEMIKLAIEGFNQVKVCEIESKLDGKSYTFRTIEKLKKESPFHDFLLIVGSDILGDIDRWMDYEKLLQKTDFIIFEREGYLIENKFGIRIDAVIKRDVTGLSSTEVRRCVRRGESLMGLVPENVENYIKNRGLYK